MATFNLPGDGSVALVWDISLSTVWYVGFLLTPAGRSKTAAVRAMAIVTVIRYGQKGLILDRGKVGAVTEISWKVSIPPEVPEVNELTRSDRDVTAAGTNSGSRALDIEAAFTGLSRGWSLRS